jgi:arsenate reductase
VEIQERDFFKTPFDASEIQELLEKRPASEMFSFRSPAFKKLGLHRGDLSEDKLIELMLQEPRLIRRPVVRIGDAVYFGADRKLLETLIVRAHG